jgi:ABC-type lipoprotein release transport system permease subunit
LAEQGLPRIFYGSITAREIIITLVFTLMTASLSALLPAMTASRLEPVEAMRFTA